MYTHNMAAAKLNIDSLVLSNGDIATLSIDCTYQLYCCIALQDRTPADLVTMDYIGHASAWSLDLLNITLYR